MTGVVLGASLVDLSTVSLPFTVADMVSAGMAILGLVAGFVLLSLAFQFVPRFIAVIKSSWGGGRR